MMSASCRQSKTSESKVVIGTSPQRSLRNRDVQLDRTEHRQVTVAQCGDSGDAATIDVGATGAVGVLNRYLAIGLDGNFTNKS